MTRSHRSKALTKLIQVIEDLSSDKQIAATKWLEGVIVGQVLSEEERQNIVKAVNEYISSVDEAEYAAALNALIEYLKKVQTIDESQICKDALLPAVRAP